MPTAKPRPAVFCQALPRVVPVLLLALSLAAPAARAQPESPVTSEGFEALAKRTTFYAPLPMIGTLAEDCPPEAVHQALKAADDNPHIKHAVFMIDSESGWPLENDHIGGFKPGLEITAVVRTALAPAIFPVFFADHVYMTDTALVGGLALHNFTGRGSKEVTAKQVGIYSSMLASAAQSRGHAPAIAYAMIDKNKSLYAWQHDGQTKLSNTKPGDDQPGQRKRRIPTVLPSEVLILDQQAAQAIGFAKPIDAFDHWVVGEYLGIDNWTPANRFGRVANGIGMVVAELEPLREEIREMDKRIPDLKDNDRYPEEEIKGFKQFKNNMDRAVKQLDMINTALADLYAVHPERHAYAPGPDGKTLVADTEQWEQDMQEARRQVNLAATQLRVFTEGFRKLGGDAEYLYDVNQRLDEVVEHLRGIERYGNVQYWEQHAPEQVPDDVYG